MYIWFRQDAPHLPIDGKLKEVLKATPGACLEYVVIEGKHAFTDQKQLWYFFPTWKAIIVSDMYLFTYMQSLGAVQPVGEPLTSPSKNVNVGVLQKFILSEHRLVWNSFTRSW